MSASAAPLSVNFDVCQTFVLAGGAFRGRVVRLASSVSEIVRRHNDADAVSELLCEAMVSAVALAAGIKYDGVFTLQAQGKGAVHTLVADITSDGHLRACAKYDDDKLKATLARGKLEHLAPHLLGAGHLAFTVDQGPDTERYQGIVELGGTSIAESVHNYFRQSEQIASALVVAVAPPDQNHADWRAGAIVIQRMPDVGGRPVLSDDDAEDAWRTAVILMGSVTKKEIVDVTLPPAVLLHRLFATIGVNPTTAKPIQFGCRCSRDRSERILASFPADEVKALAEDGVIRMTCEFCRTDYVFTETEIDQLANRDKA
ncbi:MAG: Hsp33 family molecular chaperone HslO [Rhodospirillaceae bacterium]|nr:Hsp33 family molecular chaperone HslO [Rhodospirillaceae bacterium]